MLLPKAELHLHIEGTFEPELIFALARKNKIQLKYPSQEALKAAYEFEDLQSFLDLYYQGMQVLKEEEDFAQLARAYFQKAQSQGVKHAEIFFDPQAHMNRGLKLETVLKGLGEALKTSKKDFDITSKLIACFLRDQSEESALAVLDKALKYQESFCAIGLDSAERGNPPSKFARLFAKARANGLLTVAHAGEEGPPDYVWQALDLLKVNRIDHGVRSLEDPKLVAVLAEKQIPLTVCPLSNVKLKVFEKMADHNIKQMLEKGILATVNSDDPAYFGGYVEDNFQALEEAIGLNLKEKHQLCANSFQASFLPEAEKQAYIQELDALVNTLE
jgi:adenosine deaminase